MADSDFIPISGGAPAAPSSDFIPLEGKPPEQPHNPEGGWDQRPIFDKLATKYAMENGIPPSFGIAVMRVENPKYDPQAVNHDSGATGLMQVLPSTASGFGKGDLTNPEWNIRVGMGHLAFLYNKYHGDRALASAAYNAGEGAVEKYKGIPPYQETINYVRSVSNWFNQLSQGANEMNVLGQAIGHNVQAGMQLPPGMTQEQYTQWIQKHEVSPYISPSTTQETYIQSLSTITPKRDPDAAYRSALANLESNREEQNRTMMALAGAASIGTYELANAIGEDPGKYFKGQSDYTTIMMDMERNPDDWADHLNQLWERYGFNAPPDILHWADQPGIAQKIAESKGETPGELAWQIMLGAHADLARQKSNYPEMTGVETWIGEQVDPGWLSVNLLTTGIGTGVEAAVGEERMAALSALGQRYAAASEKYGYAGDLFHSNAAVAHSQLRNEIELQLTEPEYFGNLTTQEQDAVVQMVQGDIPIDPKYAGRVKNIIAYKESSDAMYAELDPVRASKDLKFRNFKAQLAQQAQDANTAILEAQAAGKTVTPEQIQIRDYLVAENARYRNNNFFPHEAMFKRKPGAAEVPTQRAHPTPFFANNPVVQSPRAMGDSFAEAMQNPSLQRDTTVNAAYALINSETRLRRYLKTLEQAQNAKLLKDEDGNPGRIPITYRYTPPRVATTGPFEANWGEGPMGLKVATKEVDVLAEEQALREAQNSPGMKYETAKAIQDKRDELLPGIRKDIWGQIRRNFNEKHPDYNFDTADVLRTGGALRGEALSDVALNAITDANPIYSEREGVRAEEIDPFRDDGRPFSSAEGALDYMNSVVRQALIANFLYHPAINIAPLIMSLARNPAEWAWLRVNTLKALAGAIPTEWKNAIHAMGPSARAPRFGGINGIDPKVRARLLTTAYKDKLKQIAAARNLRDVPLDLGSAKDLMNIAALRASKWNMDLVFGFFEDNLTAVGFQHLKRQGMSDAEAAVRLRKLTHDYENLSKNERSGRNAIKSWIYFYTWAKGQILHWGEQAWNKPQNIVAPVTGIERSNQQQGAPPMGPYDLALGRDDKGNWRVMPLPLVSRVGGELINVVGAPIMQKSGGLTPALYEIMKMVKNRVNPIGMVPVGITATAMGQAQEPQPWNEVLFNKSPGVPTYIQSGEAITEYLGRFTPYGIKAAALAAKEGDAAALIGMFGPGMYYEPPQQVNKQTFRTQQDLQTIINNPAFRQQSNSQQNAVLQMIQDLANGDSRKLGAAQMFVKFWKRVHPNVTRFK